LGLWEGTEKVLGNMGRLKYEKLELNKEKNIEK